MKAICTRACLVPISGCLRAIEKGQEVTVEDPKAPWLKHFRLVEDQPAEPVAEQPAAPQPDPAQPAGEVSYPVHVGGGYFLLSNGEKVRGKENAEAAEAELVFA